MMGYIGHAVSGYWGMLYCAPRVGAWGSPGRLVGSDCTLWCALPHCTLSVQGSSIFVLNTRALLTNIYYNSLDLYDLYQ